EEEVHHNDGDEAGDEGVRRRATNARRTALAVKPLETADEPNHRAEGDGLRQPGEHVVAADELAGELPVLRLVDAEPADHHEPPADDAHQVAEHREYRDHEDAGYDP